MQKIVPIFFLILAFTSLKAQQSDYIINSTSFRSPASAIDVSPDGKWVLVGFEDGTLSILDAGTLEELLTIKEAGRKIIFDIEMTPLMDVILVASGNQIRLFDNKGEYITNWNFHRNTIWNMDINPEGTFMVSTEVNRTFLLVNVFEGNVDTQMRAHEDITYAVAFSPDGKTIASGSSDTKVFLWDFESRSVTNTFNGLSSRVYDVVFSPDGKYLAAGSLNDAVCIWDIAENKLLRKLKGHTEMVLEVEFSPDSKYLLSASGDQTIILWDVETGDELFSYIENDGSVPDIQFLPGKNVFASVCLDGSVKIREIHPEIFVLKYFYEEYQDAISSNPVFLPRQKKEKKAEYEERVQEAEKEKDKLIEFYYQKYLENK